MLMNIMDKKRECSELLRIWGKGSELASIANNPELHYWPLLKQVQVGSG